MRFGKNINKVEQFDKITKEFGVVQKDWHSNYLHNTFAVKELSEFLEVINFLTDVKSTLPFNTSMIYRGMADDSWKLEPSLARCSKFSSSTEHEIVNEFTTMRPDAFNVLNSNFERLAKMQHYGAPTRLLDFTSNPLIAMFFACQEKECTDGRIVCASPKLEHYDNFYKEKICSCCFKYPILDNISLNSLLNHSISDMSYFNRFYSTETDNLLFSRPLYSNQRIINQSAFFLVFPNRLYDGFSSAILAHMNGDETLGYVEPDFIGNPPNEVIQHWDHLHHIKQMIQIEGNKDRFFCKKAKKYFVTDEYLNSIYSKYMTNEQYEMNEDFEMIMLHDDIFSDRFTVDYTLESVDQNILQDELCSIIVPKEYKSKILQELEVVGIKLDYVYPELEYTGMRITNKYR